MNPKMGRRVIFVITVLLSSAVVDAAQLSKDEQRLVDWIDTNTDSAIALLEETVNIGSGTMNHQGVRDVGSVLRRELDALGLETRWVKMPAEMQRAGHLFARKISAGGPKILMVGHLDTVFEADDDFKAFKRDGDEATGPGVSDMKSGNVVIIYALKALKSIGALDELSIMVAYTGDEENAGSPLALSKHDLIEAGKWADFSLGFEDGVSYDDQDWATIARRSSSNWKLTVSGQQAHSSRIFSEKNGHGAIFEASRILHEFDRQLSREEYLTFNVGSIVGGTDITYDEQQNRGTAFGKSNVIPSKVVMHGDIRAISQEQLERTRNEMMTIVAAHLPKTDGRIEFEDRYPAMAPTDGNKRLHKLFSAINEDLGRGAMPVLDPSRRGAADISFVAPYSDSLAGLGALGEGGHTPHESLDLTSLPLAIKRAAILLYRLSRQ